MRNEQHIQWLLEGVEAWNRRREPGGDLHGDITDFSDVNLRVEFENAGQINPAERIPLAGYDLSGSDLTLSILNRANLARAILTDANLTGADLTGADLTGADLTDADLTGANLTGANLTGANLTGANLTGADLTDANLTDASIWFAKFIGTVCRNANFRGAGLAAVECAGAEFIGANFTGSNLAGTKLLNANIYGSDEKSSKQYPDTELRIESVGGLMDEIKEINKYYDHTEGNFAMFFRGECMCGWELRPSIMRYPKLRQYEGDMLTDLISQRPEEFNGMVSGLGQWVTAQHHGLKTRFLDVSKNPLVALYHACSDLKEGNDARLHVFVAPQEIVKPFISDTVSIISNYAKLRTVHQEALVGKHGTQHPDWYNTYSTAMEQLCRVIRSEKPAFASEIDPRDFYRVIIVEPQQSLERIRTQSGAFLVSAFHERFETDKILEHNRGTPVYEHYKLAIPGNRKPDIMEELRILNITEKTLLPGLDASARAIMASYSQRRER